MKKILTLLALAAATTVQADDISGLSKSQINAKDQQTWGKADFSFRVDPGSEATLASEMVEIKDRLARETVTIAGLVKTSRDNLGSSSEPEFYLKEAIKLISRPLSTQGKRDFAKLYPTPAQQEAIKGYTTGLKAISTADRMIRVKMRSTFESMVKQKVFSNYLKFKRTQQLFGETTLVKTLETLDTRYPKLLKTFDELARGHGRYAVLANLETPEKRDAVYEKILDDCKLVSPGGTHLLTAKGGLTVRFGRSVYMLDKYLDGVTDAKIDEAKAAQDAIINDHNKAADAVREAGDWYKKNALDIPPQIREPLARLISAYSTCLHENHLFDKDFMDLIDVFKDESRYVCRLRKDKGFNKSQALHLTSGNYYTRLVALSKDVRKRFDDAVAKFLALKGKTP
jgi:hypothetical protein